MKTIFILTGLVFSLQTNAAPWAGLYGGMSCVSREHKEGFGWFAKYVVDDRDKWIGNQDGTIHEYVIFYSSGPFVQYIQRQVYKVVHVGEYECIEDVEVYGRYVRGGSVIGVTNNVGNLVGTRIKFEVKTLGTQTFQNAPESRTVHFQDMAVIRMMNGSDDTYAAHIMVRANERDFDIVKGLGPRSVVNAKVSKKDCDEEKIDKKALINFVSIQFEVLLSSNTTTTSDK